MDESASSLATLACACRKYDQSQDHYDQLVLKHLEVVRGDILIWRDGVVLEWSGSVSRSVASAR